MAFPSYGRCLVYELISNVCGLSTPGVLRERMFPCASQSALPSPGGCRLYVWKPPFLLAVLSAEEGRGVCVLGNGV